MTVDTISLRRPDDLHLHVRDGEAMASVIGHTAAEFARAIIMPNLKPPVTTVAAADAYRQRILAALPAGADFQPLMTLYLTEATRLEDIDAAADSDFVHAVKLYPAGATTNADSGVTDMARVRPVLERMQARGLPLLVHGEVTDPQVDVFDREAVFIERVLGPLCNELPELKVVFEHITTAAAVEFVAGARPGVAATITVHHLLLNRNALFDGGLRPHHYCLPVVKRERHRLALVAAATGGSERFFLGTDSAPHPLSAKHSDCGCAGIYTAHAAMALYAEVFEAAGALDRLEAFASEYGARFYGLPPNPGRLLLRRQAFTVPASYALGQESLVPFRAGGNIAWQVVAE